MAEINYFLIASAVILGIAQVLIVVGVATPRWVIGPDFKDGLYNRVNTTSGAKGDPSGSGFWITARSLLVESCIGVFLAVVLLGLFMAMVHYDKLERYRKCCSYAFPSSVLSSSLFAAVFIAISLILIDVDVHDFNSYSSASFGYSFYIAMASCIILPFAGGLAFHGRTPKPKIDMDDQANPATVVALENGDAALREKSAADVKGAGDS